MIADHLIEAAGHIKARISELEKAREARVLALPTLDAERARVAAEIAELAKRIAHHHAALDTLKNQPGKVSLWNRLFGAKPLADVPQPTELAPIPTPQGFSEIIPTKEDRGPSQREIALRNRAQG